MCMHRVLLVASALSALSLAACSGGQSGGGQVATGASPAQPTAAGSGQATQYKASVALVGSPVLAAKGQNILVTVKVVNEGTTAFSSASQPHNVNLGAHAVNASGAIVVNDLARGHLPQVAPGAAVQASILLPVKSMLGHRAQILPVEEGVAWFNQWGTKPLVVGPFEACANASVGPVCDASGKPLSSEPANP